MSLARGNLLNVNYILTFLSVLVPGFAWAEVEPVTIRAAQQEAWRGQRVPFFVELRVAGPFVGTANFSLPQIPRTVIVKVGNPVVSSQQIDGESWFVQTHEFALFSQATGAVEIPVFQVRFSSRDGFTGPVIDHEEQVPAMRFEIQQSPSGDEIGFLVATSQIDISELWDPQPGPTNVGAVFRRTIAQQADQMTGMAFSPPPAEAIDGIRIYLGKPEVIDRTERGEFLGQRRDTITYVLQRPGTFTVPATSYVWWNPDSKQYGSTTLPAVTFDVAALPTAATTNVAQRSLWWTSWLALSFVAVGVGFWQHKKIKCWLERSWNRLNPPDQIAARRLLRACRCHDADAAENAWIEWRNTKGPEFEPIPRLRSAALGLQRHLFGAAGDTVWRGTQLGRALREQLSLNSSSPPSGTVDLPLLNPSI